MNINAQTRFNAVIGNPIQHSHSPAFHQALYEAMGINAVMLAIENPSLPEYVQSIRTLSIGLTAVTLPFKTAVLDYVDSCSEAVSVLKAANTLLYKNGKIHAENTDVHGIKATLSDIALQHKRVLIVGAGGTARAAGYALHDQHASLFWTNRTLANANILAHLFGGDVIAIEDLNAHAFDIIIQTTPVGMHPDIEASPLPNYLFNAHQIVLDCIYTPQDTRLLQAARQQGARTLSGTKLFAAQARQQVALWVAS